jgi:hypothetical protein
VRRFENWTKVDGKWWRPHTVRMENVQTKKSTVLETEQIKLSAGLLPQDFTVQVLER